MISSLIWRARLLSKCPPVRTRAWCHSNAFNALVFSGGDLVEKLSGTDIAIVDRCLNNDVGSVVDILNDCFEEVKSPPNSSITRVLASVVSDAQNKEGLILLTALAECHHKRLLEALNNFEAFQPVKWINSFDKTLSHFEDIYLHTKDRKQIGQTFRSTLVSNYAINGIQSKRDFIDLENFVKDVRLFWNDIIPITALWEVLFCSFDENDWIAANKLYTSTPDICYGINKCIMSLMLTLIENRQFETLMRFYDFICKNRNVLPLGKALDAGLSRLMMDQNYQIGLLDKSVELMCKDYNKFAKRTKIYYGRKDFNLYPSNPKCYFGSLMTPNQLLRPPFPLSNEIVTTENSVFS